MITTGASLINRLALLLLAGAALASCAYAQSPRHAEKQWRTTSELRLSETNDDNIFFLTDTRRAALDSFTTPASAGTRFNRMANASDFITAVRGRVEARGPGVLGHEMFVSGEARYDYYHNNTARRYESMRLGLGHSLGHGGQLRLRGEYMPTYFFRNFQSDAIDLNGDGQIQSSERVYSAAQYGQSEFAVGYRQRLLSARTDQPIGVRLDFEFGHHDRQWSAPFQSRSYKGPLGAASLLMEYGDRLQLDLDYSQASLTAVRGQAVLVLNEPDFNVDFNANGTRTDMRVRTVQSVDFSRTERQMDITLRAMLTPGLNARFSAGQRRRSFPSAQPYDIYNHLRRDRRDDFGVTLDKTVGPNMRLELGATTEAQKMLSTLLPSTTGDVTAYTRRRVFLGLTYRV
jgi:hypothetical protein